MLRSKMFTEPMPLRLWTLSLPQDFDVGAGRMLRLKIFTEPMPLRLCTVCLTGFRRWRGLNVAVENIHRTDAVAFVFCLPLCIVDGGAGRMLRLKLFTEPMPLRVCPVCFSVLLMVARVECCG